MYSVWRKLWNLWAEGSLGFWVLSLAHTQDTLKSAQWFDKVVHDSWANLFCTIVFFLGIVFVYLEWRSIPVRAAFSNCLFYGCRRSEVGIVTCYLTWLFGKDIMTEQNSKKGIELKHDTDSVRPSELWLCSLRLLPSFPRSTQTLWHLINPQMPLI
jgi:hypothetical protein